MSLLKLQQMANSGKTCYYRNQPAVIKSFDASHPGEIEIIVEINGQPQKFIKENEEKIGLFLACFTEIPVVEEVEVQSLKSSLPATNKTQFVPEIYTNTKDLFSSLSQKLLEDIDKVREKPEYVGQAKQVCNNVSAIVNITKLQLQLLQNG
jgi:hypothetical protein